MAAINRNAHRLSTTLLHVSRLLSSARGIDNTLCTLCYTLTLVHSQLQHALARQYEKLAQGLVSKASEALLPGETVLATIEAPRTRLAETCAGVRAAAELCGDMWVFMRLWGLLGVFARAHTAYRAPPRDPPIRALVWARVGVDAVFQGLENAAYLASKGVLRGEGWAARAPRWMAWSNRVWMCSVMLEVLRLLRVRQLRFNEDFGAEELDVGEKEAKVQSVELEKRWWREVYMNAAWFPMTVHWSFEDESQSPIGEAWLGFCGMVAGGMGLREVWMETA